MRDYEAEREFDVNWPHGHQNRDGDTVELLRTDLNSDRPLLGVTTSRNGNQTARQYWPDGKVHREQTCPGDLHNKSAPLASTYMLVWGYRSNKAAINVGCFRSFATEAEAWRYYNSRQSCLAGQPYVRVIKMTEDREGC